MNKTNNIIVKAILLTFGCCLTLTAGSEVNRSMESEAKTSLSPSQKQTQYEKDMPQIVIDYKNKLQGNRIEDLRLKGPKLSEKLMTEVRKTYSDHINQTQELLLDLSSNAEYLSSEIKKIDDTTDEIVHQENKNRELRLNLRMKLKEPSITDQIFQDAEASQGYFTMLSEKERIEERVQETINRLENENNRLQDKFNYLKTGVKIVAPCGDYYHYTGDCGKTQKKPDSLSQNAKAGLEYVQQMGKKVNDIINFELERLQYTSNKSDVVPKDLEHSMKYQSFRNLRSIPKQLSQQVKQSQSVIDVLRNNADNLQAVLQALKEENEYLSGWQYEIRCDADNVCEGMLVRAYNIEMDKLITLIFGEWDMEYRHEIRCDAEKVCEEILVPTYTSK